jgi:Na+-translocating ferredoxin:NAD+ oxidoreductase RnfC subunit
MPMSPSVFDAIRAAGVAGGASGRPAHLALAERAHTVLANAAECEPLQAADSHLTATRAERVLAGLQAAMVAVGAERGVVCVRADRPDALKAIRARIRSARRIRVHEVPPVYPAGETDELVADAVGEVAPAGEGTESIGVVVLNVHTLAAIADAQEGAPQIRRWVTVAGAVRSPGVLQVPVGTTVGALAAEAGGAAAPDPVYLVGGALRGRVTDSPDEPVGKGDGIVLVLPSDHSLPRRRVQPLGSALRLLTVCNQCRACTDVCPPALLGRPLEPHRVMRRLAYGQAPPDADVLSAALCHECGLCGFYVCPYDLRPDLILGRLKAELAEAGVRPVPSEEDASPRWDLRSGRRVPLVRLTSRLGLAAYAVDAHPDERPLAPEVVRVPVDGASLAVTVKTGGDVRTGDPLTAAPEPEQPAVGSHAPVDGRVESADERHVVIRSA